ncbi:hypothetical protein FACS189411_14420 [Bacteroidia bacterium]|nr:hypothetical protein FACS189411_14420 [Bacteroidia bacterium]
MFKMKKMKKMFKFFMTVAAIAAITSCSNEEIISGEGTVASSERATLSVTISGGSQATRAIDDLNANTEELKASKATIFVFNDQNVYQADTTVILGTSGIDVGNNKYKVEFHVPTGANKRVYVALNFSDAMKNAVKSSGLTAMTYAIAGQENLFYVSYNTTPNYGTYFGNPMFNEGIVTTDVVQGAANSANVTVERLTAKITVVKETNSPLAKGNITTSNAIFSNSDIKFAMGNKNTKILPMKEQTSWIDPNWDGNLSLYSSDFQHEFEIKGKQYNQWDDAQFIVVDDQITPERDRKTKYAFENTHELAQEGEVTYAAIAVKFTPEKIATSFDGGTNTPITTPYTTGSKADDSVFVVIDNNAYYYYADSLEAKKHTTYLNNLPGATGVSHTTYCNLTCFYRVWLNSNPSSKEYQTKRNEFYSIGLSDINRLGDPYPEIDDPTSIIGATSAITVNITVKEWSLVNMGGVILGN